jgi:hypothetical protein
MDPALKTLKGALEAIRDTTVKALAQIGQSQEEYSMRWECKDCRYNKAFYEARSIGRRWQMPQMQKHRV